FWVCAGRGRVSKTAAMPESRSCRSARSSSTRVIARLLCDEIAIEGEPPNEGIDLLERQRRRRPAFEIAAEEVIGWHAEIEGDLRGVFDDGRAVFLRQPHHPQHPTHPPSSPLSAAFTA